MFFGFRVVLDLISFIIGFILMHNETILARSYIMLGVVILVEIGSSAYCTFMLSKIETEVLDQENQSINRMTITHEVSANGSPSTQTLYQ